MFRYMQESHVCQPSTPIGLGQLTKYFFARNYFCQPHTPHWGVDGCKEIYLQIFFAMN